MKRNIFAILMFLLISPICFAENADEKLEGNESFDVSYINYKKITNGLQYNAEVAFDLGIEFSDDVVQSSVPVGMFFNIPWANKMYSTVVDLRYTKFSEVMNEKRDKTYYFYTNARLFEFMIGFQFQYPVHVSRKLFIKPFINLGYDINLLIYDDIVNCDNDEDVLIDPYVGFFTSAGVSFNVLQNANCSLNLKTGFEFRNLIFNSKMIYGPFFGVGIGF